MFTGEGKLEGLLHLGIDRNVQPVQLPMGYVYGRKIFIDTDHQPLESIMKKSRLSAPRRLQRILLHLQKFDLDVSYTKGKEMHMADPLS